MKQGNFKIYTYLPKPIKGITTYITLLHRMQIFYYPYLQIHREKPYILKSINLRNTKLIIAHPHNQWVMYFQNMFKTHGAILKIRKCFLQSLQSSGLRADEDVTRPLGTLPQQNEAQSPMARAHPGNDPYLPPVPFPLGKSCTFTGNCSIWLRQLFIL